VRAIRARDDRGDDRHGNTAILNPRADAPLTPADLRIFEEAGVLPAS
jgi:hypothetical protein